MEDIAELGLSVDSGPVERGRRSLKEFEDQSVRTERAAKGLETTTALLTKAMGFLGAVLGVNELIRMTSAWTDLNSRVRNAVGAHENAADVMKRIDEMARRTYSSLTQTAEGFLDNNIALKQLGYSTSQQLDLQETLNNALVVSATKGLQAESVMNAWSKAMALGKLSGDNLNTVIMSGGRVAQALADSMGVSVLELRNLGAQGKITSDDMFGITSQLQKLREEADAMPPTIVDAFVLINNALMATIGKLDEFTGASAAIAKALIDSGDAADQIIPILGALASVVAGALVPSIVSATLALGAFALTPIGIASIAVSGLAYMLTQMWNEQRLAEQAARDHSAALDINANSLEAARSGSQRFRDELRANITVQISAAEAALKEAEAQRQAAIARVATANAFNTGMDVLASIFGMYDPAKSSERQQTYESGIMGAWQQSLTESAVNLAALKAQATELDAILTTPAGADTTMTPERTVDPTDAQVKARKAYDDLLQSVQQRIASANLEAQVLGMTSEAANRMRIEQELLNKAANDNIDLTTIASDGLRTRRQELLDGADATAAAEERTRLLTQAANDNARMWDMAEGTASGFFKTLSRGGDVFDYLIGKVFDLSDALIDMSMRDLFGGLKGGGFNPLDFLGGLFAGGLNFTPATTGLSTGLPLSFAGGGYTGDGPRSGGVDGQGGFRAILHPRETVTDHTVANQNVAPNVTIEMPVYNYSSASVRKIEEPDGKGGRRQALVIEDMVAGAFSRPGSSASRAAAGVGGVIDR